MSGSDHASPVVVDARGRRCPLPVIDLARAARGASPGSLLDLLADDPAASGDVAAWCRLRGHALVSAEPLPEDPAVTTFRVRVGEAWAQANAGGSAAASASASRAR